MLKQDSLSPKAKMTKYHVTIMLAERWTKPCAKDPIARAFTRYFYSMADGVPHSTQPDMSNLVWEIYSINDIGT
jgi:hypothetical protein